MLYGNLVLTLNTPSFFCSYRLISLGFFTFSIVFSKTALLVSFKKSFSKSVFAVFLSSIFVLMYGFNQAFSLNLMTLCTFFKPDPSFSACFKFLMWIKYYSSSCRLATHLSMFSFFILSSKKSKSLRSSFNFLEYSTSA